VVGREGVLAVGEDFLVELLSGTEAAVFYLDVHVRLEACEVDHPSCKVVDLDRLAHVEDEDLVAGAHRRSFHHEAAGLGDGHEEAGDLGMGDRDRASLRDLLAEARDHRAVRAEDVAEPSRHELRFAGLPALFHRQAHRLHVDLRQALGAAHYVGRVDSLVGGHHDHLLHVVLDAFVCHVARSRHVYENRLAWVIFHERDVLIGCGVEDHLRTPLAERIVQARKQAHVAYDRYEVQLGELLLQLQAEVVHRCLPVVVEDETFHPEGRQLAAKLGADGARSTCHHDRLAAEVGDDIIHRYLDLGTHQKVLDLYVPEGVAHLAVDHLVDRRSEEELDADRYGVLDHAVALGAGVFFSGEEDRVRVSLGDGCVELLLSSDVIGLQFGDDVGDVAAAILEESYYIIMWRVLQPRNQGDGLHADAVDQHVLAFLAAVHLALDQVVGQKHGHPQKQEGGAGHEEVCQEEDVQPQAVAHDHAVGQAHEYFLSEGNHDEAAELADGHVPDDDAVGAQTPYQEERRHQGRSHPGHEGAVRQKVDVHEDVDDDDRQ